MSFEENPSKNIPMIENTSDFSMEFNNLKDPKLLRQKLAENKTKYQRKLQEFELVLRFLEKKTLIFSLTIRVFMRKRTQLLLSF